MGDVVDLRPPGGQAPTSLAEMVRCVDRELGFRAKVYPRWVRDRKMRSDQAELEIRRMRAVRDRLILAEAEHTIMTGLAEKAGVSEVDLALLVRQAEAAAHAMFPIAAPPAEPHP